MQRIFQQYSLSTLDPFERSTLLRLEWLHPLDEKLSRIGQEIIESPDGGSGEIANRLNGVIGELRKAVRKDPHLQESLERAERMRDSLRN
jgi:hypothetical protein